MATLVSDLLTSLDLRLSNDPNGEFWTPEARIDVLDEGHKITYNYFRWSFRKKLSTTTDIVSGTQGYSLPTDIQAEQLESIRVTSTTHNTTDVLLTEEPLGTYEHRVSGVTTINPGFPTRYHIAPNSAGVTQIVFDVPPDFSETDGMKIRYYKTATRLTLTTDAMELPDELSYLLVEYGLMKCKEIDEEMGLADDYMQKWFIMLNRVKQDYMKGSDYVAHTFAQPRKDIYPLY